MPNIYNIILNDVNSLSRFWWWPVRLRLTLH